MSGQSQQGSQAVLLLKKQLRGECQYMSLPRCSSSCRVPDGLVLSARGATRLVFPVARHHPATLHA